MHTLAIRGATNIYENTEEDIIASTRELLEEIIEKNKLDLDRIFSIIFTATDDISKAYPAVAARELGLTKAGLMCLNEMYVEGSMRNCLRVMVFYNGDIDLSDIKHVYLKDTVKLRPDLI